MPLVPVRPRRLATVGAAIALSALTGCSLLFDSAGGGSAGTEQTEQFPPDDRPVKIQTIAQADANGDELTDLILLSGPTDPAGAGVYLMAGPVDFESPSAQFIPLSFSPRAVDLAQLIGDSLPELVVSGSDSQGGAVVAVLPQTAPGQFAAPLSYTFPSSSAPEFVAVRSLDPQAPPALIVVDTGEAHVVEPAAWTPESLSGLQPQTTALGDAMRFVVESSTPGEPLVLGLERTIEAWPVPFVQPQKTSVNSCDGAGNTAPAGAGFGAFEETDGAVAAFLSSNGNLCGVRLPGAEAAVEVGPVGYSSSTIEFVVSTTYELLMAGDLRTGPQPEIVVLARDGSYSAFADFFYEDIALFPGFAAEPLGEGVLDLGFSADHGTVGDLDDDGANELVILSERGELACTRLGDAGLEFCSL